MIARPQVWVAQLAGRFWSEVGDPPPFPRDLRESACWVPELNVQEVPNLTLASATEHFRAAGIPCPDPDHDRPLCGCFGSLREKGFILLDPNDEPDQLRFTFAHELAHFLRDFREPRRLAEVRFGPAILDVLDNKRPPTVTERLAGALRGINLSGNTHFLERDRWGRVADERARESEEAADRLAFELLAPFTAVNPAPGAKRRALAERLVSVFGLPLVQATKYATVLIH